MIISFVYQTSTMMKEQKKKSSYKDVKSSIDHENYREPVKDVSPNFEQVLTQKIAYKATFVSNNSQALNGKEEWIIHQ